MPSEGRRSATRRLAGIPEDLRRDLGRVKAVLMDADGVLTDGRIHVHSDGSEIMSFDVRDGSGLWLLHRAGVRLAVVTGRSTGIPEHRARSVPFDVVRSGVKDKDVVVREVLAQWGIAHEDAVFIGDDVLDGPALRVVGVPVCVADSVPDVLPLARYVTELPGGRGAVREVADLVLEARGDLRNLLARFLGDETAPR